MNKTQIPALTGLRFFAAYWVIGYHYFNFKDPLLFLNQIFSRGNMGVPFFFILSGFVINLNYYDKKISYGKFITKRISKIIPLYYIALILAIPVLAFSIDNSSTWTGHLPTIFINLFLLQGILPIPRYTMGWNTPGWSISIELLFYLLYPFINKTRMGPFKNHYLNMFFLLAISILLNYIKPVLPETIYFHGHNIRFDFTSLFIFRMISFLCGMNLYHIYKNISSKKITFKWDILLMIFTHLSLLLIFTIPDSKIHAEHPLILAIFGSYILYCAYSPCINYFFDRRHWLLLGQASYAMYILQAPIHFYTDKFYLNVLEMNQTKGFYYIFILSMIIVMTSILVHLFVEEPIKIKLRKFNW